MRGVLALRSLEDFEGLLPTLTRSHFLFKKFRVGTGPENAMKIHE